MKDTVDPVMDRLLARFVVGVILGVIPSSRRMLRGWMSGLFWILMYAVTVFFHFLVADPFLQIIPQDILRKYVMSAHEKITPKLYDLDQETLSSVHPLPCRRPQVLSSTSALLSTPLSSPMSWNTSTRARASERRLNSSLIHPRAGKRTTPKKRESTN